jgi:hypothetical protein
MDINVVLAQKSRFMIKRLNKNPEIILKHLPLLYIKTMEELFPNF